MLQHITLVARVALFMLLIISTHKAKAQDDNLVSGYTCYTTGPSYAQINNCTMFESTSAGYIASDIFGVCDDGQLPVASQYVILYCNNEYLIQTSAFSTRSMYLTDDGCGYYLLGQVNAISGIQDLFGDILAQEWSSDDCDYERDQSAPGTFWQSPC